MQGICKGCKFNDDLNVDGFCYLCFDLGDCSQPTKQIAEKPNTYQIRTFPCIYCDNQTFNTDMVCKICKKSTNILKEREYCSCCGQYDYCENEICDNCVDLEGTRISKTYCLDCKKFTYKFNGKCENCPGKIEQCAVCDRYLKCYYGICQDCTDDPKKQRLSESEINSGKFLNYDEYENKSFNNAKFENKSFNNTKFENKSLTQTCVICKMQSRYEVCNYCKFSREGKFLQRYNEKDRESILRAGIYNNNNF